MALIVNGERIEDAAVQEDVERMRAQYEESFPDQPPEEREATLLEWARENTVERTLLGQAAASDPKPIPPDELAKAYGELVEQHGGEEDMLEHLGLAEGQLGEVKADVERRLRVQRLLDSITGGAGKPSDAEVEAYYEEHKTEFMMPEMLGVAHVVKHIDSNVDPATARQQIEEAKRELDAGADFGEVAERHSDCPDRGGDLGYFPRGHMVEEFEHVAFSMPVGGVSDIFPSRFGFHIAKVYDRKAPAPAPLAEAREQIEQAVAQQAGRAKLEAYLDKLRQGAAIEVIDEAPEAGTPDDGGEEEA